MKKILLFASTILFLLVADMATAQEKAPITQAATTFVTFETNEGDFTIALYDGTPRHRDNFLKNVRAGSYTHTIFHRIIDRFVVQGGNFATKNATPETNVNEDPTSGKMPHEINPSLYYHNRGALCSAREGNEVNPEKQSSTHQFYIVTGTFYTDLDLDDIEKARGLTYTEEQRKSYKINGGTPQLDGEYTVFGEVVKGMDVINKIQSVKTDSNNRPKKDIIIEKLTIHTK